MTKAELVDKILNKAEIPTRAKAEQVLEALISSLQEALVAGETVTFSGFGSFKVNTRAERQGHNPRTGEVMTIPSCKVVKFTPGKGLKEAINA